MGKYKDEINNRIDKQIAKGVSKYGQPLEQNGRQIMESLEYLAEELTDGLFYLEESKEKVAGMEKAVSKEREFIKQFDDCVGNTGICNINECYICDHDYEPSIDMLREALAELEVQA